ncbi:MAG: membrane-bound lytic murein transglycosylase MltF [Gammaproteobacteria bacterium]|nr:membrane-bound lytic murein transglycosylase MltF [Gammaproteobacteria bacterium]NNC97096.1 membrane-bound lytic murein transglycosylase MltF [Gammaproteobacteria bacterium]NNM14108.1 membrane-bound lytic murein transglycosylase MltF [Gammaproteobacteria bacterium]
MTINWARNPENLKWLSVLAILVILSLLLVTCSPGVSPYQEIIETGELRVVTRENPSTYFIENGEANGFEYDLAQGFADFLGVELKIYPASVSQALADVENGRAHIAAAGLSVTEARKLNVNFGPAYQEVTQILLGRQQSRRPKDLSELPNFNIAVLKDSSHQERLIQLKANFPYLSWDEKIAQSSLDLMRLLEAREFDLTIVDSVEFAVTQRYFPKLIPLFDLTEPQELAWALPENSPQLQLKVAEFFNLLETSGDLDQLKEYHFGYIKSFDYVEVTSFTRDIDTRLQDYIGLFKQAEQNYGLDWKLLAAISYQESHWRRNAISPTGVRGLMMLTKHTAAEMGIADRRDPAQSIDGGTRYLLKVMDKIPKRIKYPDRLWFALAGYNVGFGHLEDARILTERAGNNPDLWSDVREHLPLLSEKKYYSTVKRGKARGSEPVKYVENIRDYYDLLRWLTRENEVTADPQAESDSPETQDQQSDEEVTVPQEDAPDENNKDLSENLINDEVI